MILRYCLKKFAIINQLYCTYSTKAHSTIYAISSGQGKCGVAVIRVSGPESSSVLRNIAGLKEIPEPRKALLRRLRHPQSSEVVDQSLVLWFPGPHSFTGEDSCELQVHGGMAVVAAMLDALASLPGLRPAEPGEFTKRAFYSNKIDLTGVEGLRDLIAAETELQRRQALHQMEGALSRRYSQWRTSLKRCLAHVEAYIDFSEDQHIEDDILQMTNEEAKLLKHDILNHLQDGRRGERMRDGVRTVIAGAPNVGKSSLLNKLCNRPAAIVSSQPGTTRDIVSATLDISGFPVLLADTAGLRNHTSDMIEQEGIRRAHETVSAADLQLLVIDATCYTDWAGRKSHGNLKFADFLETYLEELHLKESMTSCSNIQSILKSGKVTIEPSSIGSLCLIILNKLDLVSEKSLIMKVCEEYSDNVIAISCKDDDLFRPLLDVMTTHLKILCGNPTRESACLSHARHRYHLTACVSALDRYLQMCGSEREIDQAAYQLRQALTALGHITGHVSSEQILDVIFRDFCIGK